MLTLTFRPGVDWFASQIRELLTNVRNYLARRGVKFENVWVMELTQAGVPHYHVLIRLPKGVTLPKPDKRGWWPHGSTRIEWARNAIGYIAKYASKGDENSEFPKAARISGSGGLTKDERTEKAWWVLPRWVRDVFPDSQVRVAKVRGGYASTETGEFLPSPYLVTISGGVILITMKGA